MLSFSCVHALTACLLHLDDILPPLPPDQLGRLLLIQDRPHGDAEPALRKAQLIAVALLATPPAEHSLPAVLQQLAHHFGGGDGPPPLRREHLQQLRARLRQPARLLGRGVCYDDRPVDDPTLIPLRRIDAVDVDGRIYRLRRRLGKPGPVVLLDEQPGPGHLPATHAWLSRIQAACRPHPTDA